MHLTKKPFHRVYDSKFFFPFQFRRNSNTQLLMRWHTVNVHCLDSLGFANPWKTCKQTECFVNCSALCLSVFLSRSSASSDLIYILFRVVGKILVTCTKYVIINIINKMNRTIFMIASLVLCTCQFREYLTIKLLNIISRKSWFFLFSPKKAQGEEDCKSNWLVYVYVYSWIRNNKIKHPFKHFGKSVLAISLEA